MNNEINEIFIEMNDQDFIQSKETKQPFTSTALTFNQSTPNVRSIS